MPDVARLQPTPEALNVILKNTFFSDDLLNTDAKIGLTINYTMGVPVLIFKFQQPYYDFTQVLSWASVKGTNEGWLHKDPVIIKLVMADSVITDHLFTRLLFLSPSESRMLRRHLQAQALLPAREIQNLEAAAYSRSFEFLK